MKARYTLMLGITGLLCSCSTIRMTSDSAEVKANISAYPTVADLHISPQRVSKSIKWKWNPFSTTTLSMRKGNVKAELIREAGADILVEPEFIQHTTWLNLLGGSLTVTGYAATLENFRKATPQDIEALKAAGMLTDNKAYVVLRQNGINGVIVGISDCISPSPEFTNLLASWPERAPENDSSGTESQTIEPRNDSENTIPAPETVTEKPKRRETMRSSYPPLKNDQIGKTRYLTTMAREYYGDANFWPYIYEENKDRLGHPDKIKPGTSVVIPDLRKYDIDPELPADMEKAKALAKEIYARFGKSL